MPPLSYPLAIALLVTPGSIENPSHFQHLADQLRGLAFAWEVLDERELPLYFHEDDQFVANLDEARRWTRKMLDAPPDSCRRYFPSWEQIGQSMRFNRMYYQHLKDQIGMEAENDDALNEAIVECNRIYWVYDRLKSATDKICFIAIRRNILEMIRDNDLGPEMFDAGQLPPPIPLHLLRQIR